MPDPEHPDPVIDQAVLLDRFEGDVTFLSEIAAIFLEDCPHRLDAMRAALADDDAAALQRAAHSLKGSVSNFAADAATEAARRLEMIGRDGDLTHAAAACAALEREIARLIPALIRLTQVGGAMGDHAHADH